jgi:hypothetical protein
MAAPKDWGYTRDQAIPDEVLVSWADGDLTAQVAKEVDECLLGDREERIQVAAFARAAADTVGEEITRWNGKRPGKRALHMLPVRDGLLDSIVELGPRHPGDWESGKTLPRPTRAGISASRVAGTVCILAVAAVVILWMVLKL